ncbi:biofilm formation regulator BacA [Thauera sp. SDU_THAU2]|uniref:biofilm formation regulator BacA n=1 Tax=Thauera sp. SDU_THAU2 TaxID=3136633 RepID=UPI00311D571C
MERKTSAYYQRLHRARLREQGLVKKELWVLPEYLDALSSIEKSMRQPWSTAGFVQPGQEKENTMTEKTLWTVTALHDALRDSPLVASGAARLELLDGADPSLLLQMHDYGDLPVFLAVVGGHIVVESLLWPVALVRDVAAFNDQVLRTHKLFPLSSISIETLSDGEEAYIMFGALSAASSLADVALEIETLADNVIRATEAFEPQLRAAD